MDERDHAVLEGLARRAGVGAGEPGGAFLAAVRARGRQRRRRRAGVVGALGAALTVCAAVVLRAWMPAAPQPAAPSLAGPAPDPARDQGSAASIGAVRALLTGSAAESVVLPGEAATGLTGEGWGGTPRAGWSLNPAMSASLLRGS